MLVAVVLLGLLAAVDSRLRGNDGVEGRLWARAAAAVLLRAGMTALVSGGWRAAGGGATLRGAACWQTARCFLLCQIPACVCSSCVYAAAGWLVYACAHWLLTVMPCLASRLRSLSTCLSLLRSSAWCATAKSIKHWSSGSLQM